jgi:hypothetical protein
MKTLFSLIFLFALALGFSGCVDETSIKPDLQIVQEAIIGYWDLFSIEAKKGTETIKYYGGCDESSYPAWAQANIGDIDYKVVSTSTIELYLKCPSTTTDNFAYKITESAGKYTLEITDGRIFEFITPPYQISGNDIELKLKSPLLQGATSAIWKFQRK